jgi:hypothetical protein
LHLSRKIIITLLVLSVFLVQEQIGIAVRAQTEPVVATDYSFYKGSLDAHRRPIARVNGYLTNESRVSFWVAVTYLANVPELAAKSRFYAPDGKLVETQTNRFVARKAGDSTTWSLTTNAIHKVKNNAGVWRVEMYYGPYQLLTENFSLGDYLVNVSIAGLPENLSAKVAIDGEEAGTIRGDEEKPSAPTFGMHTILTTATVNLSEDTRYVAYSNSLVVTSQTSHTFQYRTEYYVHVSVNSPYGRTGGSGWYAETTNATFSADSPVAGGPETRYVFTGWSGDYVGDGPKGAILVDRPKNIVADYRLQYYLRVKSEYGHPEGEGWYDEGSTATISASPSLTLPDGTKVFFLRWSGDLTSSNSSASILMDKSHSVTAEWEVMRPALSNTVSLYLTLGAYGLIVTIAVVLLFLSRRRHP